MTIEWTACDCPPALTARGTHLTVRCGHERCEETWQSPLHRPDRELLGHHRYHH